MRSKINLVLLIALLAVSTSSILARFLPNVPAVVISFWRLAIAGAILWIYTFFKRQESIERGNFILYFFSGLFLAIHFAFFYGAVKLTSIANATLLGITAPIFTIMFERFIIRRPLKPIVLLGLVFAICGALIITGSGLILKDGSMMGRLFGLMAALSISIVYLLADKLRQTANTITYTRALYTIAAILLLIISFIGGNSVLAIQSADIVWLISLGIIPTILGHSLFYYSIKYTSPTIVSSVPLGEPIIASVLAWFIYSENVPTITLFGGLLILIGVYLLVAKSPRAIDR